MLPKTHYGNYMKFKHHLEDYHNESNENKLKKKKEEEEYEKTLKQIEDLRGQELSKLKEEKEKLDKDHKEQLDMINKSIEETRLKIELEQLKGDHKKEEMVLLNEKDIEILKEQNEGKINKLKKQNELEVEYKTKGNHIELIELKYDCLKDKICNDKEFDELIEIAQKRQKEIINDELENIKESRKEVEDLEKNSKKKTGKFERKRRFRNQKKTT
jgi:hypothetical protein